MCFVLWMPFYLGFGFCLWKLEDNLFFKVSNLGKHNLFWGFDPNYERVFPCGLNDPLVSWFVFDQVQANTLVFVLFHLRCVRQIMVIRKLGFEIRIVIFFFPFFGEKLLPCFDNMNFRLSSSPLCLSLSVYFLEGG